MLAKPEPKTAWMLKLYFADISEIFLYLGYFFYIFEISILNLWDNGLGTSKEGIFTFVSHPLCLTFFFNPGFYTFYNDSISTFSVSSQGVSKVSAFDPLCFPFFSCYWFSVVCSGSIQILIIQDFIQINKLTLNYLIT